MTSPAPALRTFDPDEVWPWENRPGTGPSGFGAVFALALYFGLSAILCRGLTVFQAEVVQRERSQMNGLMRPVVGPVRVIEMDPRIAEPLRIARDPRPFSEILEKEEDASGEAPSGESNEPVGM